MNFGIKLKGDDKSLLNIIIVEIINYISLICKTAFGKRPSSTNFFSLFEYNLNGKV